MTDRRRFEEMFEYARGERLPTEAAPTVVFGRDDARVAHRAGELVAANLAEVLAITGSANGKDSGGVTARGFRSEAHFLDHELEAYAQQRRVRLPRRILEEQANNGGENARFSLAKLRAEGYLHPLSSGNITALAHATSARRLGATLERAAEYPDSPINNVYVVPTYYGFNHENPTDRHEVAAEIMRMHSFPETGFGVPQEDLTLDGPLGEYVEFAQEYLEKNKSS